VKRTEPFSPTSVSLNLRKVWNEEVSTLDTGREKRNITREHYSLVSTDAAAACDVAGTEVKLRCSLGARLRLHLVVVTAAAATAGAGDSVKVHHGWRS
jgi:hypothetical protein